MPRMQLLPLIRQRFDYEPVLARPENPETNCSATTSRLPGTMAAPPVYWAYSYIRQIVYAVASGASRMSSFYGCRKPARPR
jgi:hypothetical protein